MAGNIKRERIKKIKDKLFLKHEAIHDANIGEKIPEKEVSYL